MMRGLFVAAERTSQEAAAATPLDVRWLSP
jgi:hypothetical protein